MDTQTLLSRMGHWFKPGSRNGLNGRLTQLDENAAASGSSEPGGNGQAATGLNDAGPDRNGNGPAGAKARWFRFLPLGKQNRLDRLESSHDASVARLVAIERHLEAHHRQLDRLCHVLTDISRATACLPRSTELQTSQIDRIADTLHAATERFGHWDQTLSKLPDLAQAQNELLGQVDGRMRSNEVTGQKMLESIELLRRTAQSIQHRLDRSAESLQSLCDHTQRAADRSNERFSRLRRWVWVMMASLLLLTGLTAVQTVMTAIG